MARMRYESREQTPLGMLGFKGSPRFFAVPIEPWEFGSFMEDKVYQGRRPAMANSAEQEIQVVNPWATKNERNSLASGCLTPSPLAPLVSKGFTSTPKV